MSTLRRQLPIAALLPVYLAVVLLAPAWGQSSRETSDDEARRTSSAGGRSSFTNAPSRRPQAGDPVELYRSPALRTAKLIGVSPNPDSNPWGFTPSIERPGTIALDVFEEEGPASQRGLMTTQYDDVPPAPLTVPGVDEEWPQTNINPPEPTPLECDSCYLQDPAMAALAGQGYALHVENWSPLAAYLGITPRDSGEAGIGQERVQFAPFEMDVSQPSNYWLIRVDAAAGLRTPDRAEFFWSKAPKGPPTQNSIDYQELRIFNETGTDTFSVMTEIPVRAVDFNTTGGTSGGLGDMKVATKIRLIDGNEWQLTQIFRTYIPTGKFSKGLGAGHVSLEPGLLARYEISPTTYLHGEAKVWFPIAADPTQSATVLRYGLGVSHVLYETDRFAFIPTLEMVNFQFLGGNKTYYPGVVASTQGETAINLLPGARLVFGPPGDFGLFELGLNGMVGLGSSRYLDTMFRIDFKFIY